MLRRPHRPQLLHARGCRFGFWCGWKLSSPILHMELLRCEIETAGLDGKTQVHGKSVFGCIRWGSPREFCNRCTENGRMPKMGGAAIAERCEMKDARCVDRPQKIAGLGEAENDRQTTGSDVI